MIIISLDGGRRAGTNLLGKPRVIRRNVARAALALGRTRAFGGELLGLATINHKETTEPHVHMA